MSDSADVYDKAFFDKQTSSSSVAAHNVLAILYDYYAPSSVVDVGCGRGSWLAAARRLGCRRLRGIDGSWVNADDLLSKDVVFTPGDLEKPLAIDERFDLCMSIEVAEHLKQAHAVGFVENLCKLSEVVLFSAATKHQKGEGHINTQWPSYWVAIFASFQYTCYDVIRWRIWDNKDIAWWFRQNILLFVDDSSTTMDRARLSRDQRPIVDIVHPDNYEFLCESFGYTSAGTAE